MSMVIWKYPVQDGGSFTLNLPQGARVLTVQMQGEQAQMWVLADPNRAVEVRHFYCAETGETLTFKVGYVGTFQKYGGAYVMHLLEML